MITMKATKLTIQGAEDYVTQYFADCGVAVTLNGSDMHNDYDVTVCGVRFYTESEEGEFTVWLETLDGDSFLYGEY